MLSEMNNNSDRLHWKKIQSRIRKRKYKNTACKPSFVQSQVISSSRNKGEIEFWIYVIIDILFFSLSIAWTIASKLTLPFILLSKTGFLPLHMMMHWYDR